MTKDKIRTVIAEQKKKIGLPFPETMNTALLAQLTTTDLFKKARTIGAYAPMRDEVDVNPLMMHPERSFYIPAFDEKLGSYRMARRTGPLKRGRFGILEPENPVFAEKDDIDLILVPGIAFDLSGRRIGRGGGFYDRLLPLYRTHRVGICFDFQIWTTLPDENHDCRMDFLLTESDFIKLSVER